MIFNHRLFCLLFLLSLVNIAFAQNSNTFQPKEQFVQLRDFSSKVKYMSIWGDDPSINLDSLKLKYGVVLYDITVFDFPMQPLALLNWRFQNGEVEYEIFNNRIKGFKRRGFVKEYSSPIEEIKKSNVYVLFGFDRRKRLFMVADNNNNQRFDDDTLVGINYKSAATKDKISFTIPYSNVMLRDSNNMVKTSFSATINLNLGWKRNFTDILKLIKDSNNWLEWSNNNSSVGELKINNRPYAVFVHEPMCRSLLDENERPSIYLFDSASHIVTTAIQLKNESNSYFHSGDIALVDGGYYKFEFTDKNLKRLKVTEMPPGQYLGSKPGFFVKDFTVRDYDGAEFQFSSLPKGKYYLLDFWGSWCEPCIEKLPELQLLYKNSKEANWPLEMVSIAFDEPFAVPKLKQLKQDYLMDWRLLYDNRTTLFDRLDTSPIEQLKIACYPSFILIGPDGKILVRGCGEEGLGKVKEFFRKEFKGKE